MSETKKTSLDVSARRVGGRRVVVALVALGAIAVIVAVAIVARNSPDPLAELRIRAGAVEITSPHLETRLALEGDDLGEGDVVATNEEGQAQIDLFDASLVRLDAGTELVLSELERDPSTRTRLTLRRGRTWNRVADRSASGDEFVVSLFDATIKVKGTTFIADCRRAPECYVAGIDGTSDVSAPTGDETEVSSGDCVLLRRDGDLEDCDEQRLGLLDDWVTENLAEDEQLELQQVETVSPTPTPTPQSTVRAPIVPRPVPTPTATPKATAEAEPTPEATPTKKPKKTQTPNPPGCEAEPGGTPCPYPGEGE